MTEKRFNFLLDEVVRWGVPKDDSRLQELKAAITFEPEPVRYFQKRVGVPEPCREALKVGQKFCMPLINAFGKPDYNEYTWIGDSEDLYCLAADLVYLTAEPAIARAAAWLEVEQEQ